MWNKYKTRIGVAVGNPKKIVTEGKTGNKE